MALRNSMSIIEQEIAAADQGEHFVLMLAGGEATRWYSPGLEEVSASSQRVRLEQSKLFAPIRGEALMNRTVRQLAQRGVKQPWVYNLRDTLPLGCRRFQPENHPSDIILAMAQSASHWKVDVTILLADVVWSEEALNRVLESQPMSWRFFGKLGPNAHTKKPWGEIYALRFSAESASEVLEAINRLYTNPCWRRKLWELYRSMLQHPIPQTLPPASYVNKPPKSRNFCELPDWTDDIDEIADYERLTSLLERRSELI